MLQGALIDLINQYEDGVLDGAQEAELFQELIDGGWAWQLPSQFQRRAVQLIHDGKCTEEGCVMPALDSNTLVVWLDKLNKGTLSRFKKVMLYQYCLDNNVIWTMGEAVVQEAEDMIAAGTIEYHGSVRAAIIHP